MAAGLRVPDPDLSPGAPLSIVWALIFSFWMLFFRTQVVCTYLIEREPGPSAGPSGAPPPQRPTSAHLVTLRPGPEMHRTVVRS